MSKYTVPTSAHQRALELARFVAAGSIPKPQAEQALRNCYPEMSPRAAKGHIGAYVAMRRGTTRFGTTISANAWRLFLNDIANDGAGALSVALDAFLSHITYLQSKTKSSEAALHDVHIEFASLLKGMVVHEVILEALDREVERSLKSPTQERRQRLAGANRKPEQVVLFTRAFRRNPDVIAEILLRANGTCEACGKTAPFLRANGRPYLEVHHRERLADGGEDSVENAMALCPNCHRERHYGANYARE